MLLVRVGAHPGVLPATFPAGTDFEKLKWTPGIYDEVSLQLADNPVIESVQVAPARRVAGDPRRDEARESGRRPGDLRAGPVGEGVEGRGARGCCARGGGHARPGRVEGGPADDPGPGSPPVVAGGPVPLRPRHDDRRGLGRHALRDARVPVRHGHEARVPERPAVLRPRLQHHAPPLLRGPRRRAPSRGTRRGSAGCWWTCRRSCTGTPSASASGRCRTSGSRSPTKPGC